MDFLVVRGLDNHGSGRRYGSGRRERQGGRRDDCGTFSAVSKGPRGAEANANARTDAESLR